MNSKMLYTDSLSIGFKQKGAEDIILYKRCNLAMHNSELIALIGRNGAGKTTLLKTLCNFLPPIEGDVYLYEDGKESLMHDLPKRNVSKALSFVSTEKIIINNFSVFDFIALGRYPYTNWFGKLKNQDVESIYRSAELVGAAHLVKKDLTHLSDGERQKVMIARAIAQDTKLILLDEPTAFLDLPNKFEVIELLKKLAHDAGKTILFSSHDLHLTLPTVDKIWLLLPDSIVEGAPEDLILNDDINQLFDKTKLFFNKKDGTFNHQKQYKHDISLAAPPELYHWTKHALERAGFRVSGDQINTEIAVHAENESNQRKWVLRGENFEKEFNFIYTLIRYLMSHHSN
jgi:iron complex transport system ATP-binding protein